MMIGLPARPPYFSPFLNYYYFKTQSLTLYQTGLELQASIKLIVIFLPQLPSTGLTLCLD